MIEILERSSVPTTRSVIVHDALFSFGCGLLFAIACLALPSRFPMMEPDSLGYLGFSNTRTAIYPVFLRGLTSLGLSLEAILYVQVALFAAAVALLAAALRRWSIRRRWILLLVVLLCGNTYFSSFQRTILTESIGFATVVVATAFLLDYLRSGRVVFLATAGLFVGLMVGIRPAGLVIAPMLIVAALLMRKARDVSIVLLLLAIVVPPLAGWMPERILYRIEHGDRSASVLPNVLRGKAAMLARPDAVYSGPHAEALRELNAKLVHDYRPAQAFLAGLSSWVAWPVLTAYYEAAAHFQIIDRDLVRLSVRHGTTADAMAVELGKQAVLNNPAGYLRLSLIHYIGQWSITAMHFPPAAAEVNAYRERVGQVPLLAEISAVPFAPQARLSSFAVYPVFMLSGLVTLVLTMLLPRYLIWPAGRDNPCARSLMVAAFFAALCHSSMLLTSLINVSTPRFLMMVYPHILLAWLFLARAYLPGWINAGPASAADVQS